MGSSTFVSVAVNKLFRCSRSKTRCNDDAGTSTLIRGPRYRRRWRGGIQGHRPRNDGALVAGIQVDLLKIVVCARYVPRYILPVVCRIARIGARRLQAASRCTRCASSTSVCRHEIRHTHAALLKLSFLPWYSYLIRYRRPDHCRRLWKFIFFIDSFREIKSQWRLVSSSNYCNRDCTLYILYIPAHYVSILYIFVSFNFPQIHKYSHSTND